MTHLTRDRINLIRLGKICILSILHSLVYNRVSISSVEEFMPQLRRFNIGLAGEADCPVFDGMFQYCQTYSGGSVDGAAALAAGKVGTVHTFRTLFHAPISTFFG